jgi:hypothetical protein
VGQVWVVRALVLVLYDLNEQVDEVMYSYFSLVMVVWVVEMILLHIDLVTLEEQVMF